MLSSGTWIVGVGLVVIVLVLTESLVIPVVVTGARGRGGVHAYHLHGTALHRRIASIERSDWRTFRSRRNGSKKNLPGDSVK
jgi:hypothetical protein